MVRHDGKRLRQRINEAKLGISKKIKKSKGDKQTQEKEEVTAGALPAIFIDIDGVIFKGTGTTGFSIDVLEGSE